MRCEVLCFKDGIGITGRSIYHDIGGNNENKLRRLKRHECERNGCCCSSRNVFVKGSVKQALECLKLILDNILMLGSCHNEELIAVRHIARYRVLEYGMMLSQLDKLLGIITP